MPRVGKHPSKIGRSTSEKKKQAVRRNGFLGGRPASGIIKRYLCLGLRESTVSKIDKLRGQKKSRAELIDEWAGKISVPGLEYLELCPVKESRFKGRPRCVEK